MTGRGYERSVQKRVSGIAFAVLVLGPRSGAKAMLASFHDGGNKAAHQGFRCAAIVYPGYRGAVKELLVTPFLAQLVLLGGQDQGSVEERLVMAARSVVAVTVQRADHLASGGPAAASARIRGHHGHVVERCRRGGRAALGLVRRLQTSYEQDFSLAGRGQGSLV
jgi:hypothetical protein